MILRYQPIYRDAKGLSSYLGWYHARPEFAGGESPPSHYGGIIADRFSLAGAADPAVVQLLFHGFEPRPTRRARVDLRVRQPEILGFEILACPPKDFAYLDVVDDRIAGCVLRANDAALSLFERTVARRAALSPSHKRTLPTRSLAWATYVHRLNRDHALSLHLHSLLPNITQHPLDDRMFALDTLHFRERFGGVVALVRCELAYEIKGCRYACEIDAKGITRVPKVLQEWLDRAASRTMAIKKKKAELLDDAQGRQSSTAFAVAAVADYAYLLTRSPKRESSRSLREIAADHAGAAGLVRLDEIAADARRRPPPAAPTSDDLAKSVTDTGDRLVRLGCPQVGRLPFIAQVARTVDFAASITAIDEAVDRCYPQRRTKLDRVDLGRVCVPFPDHPYRRTNAPEATSLTTDEVALRARLIWRQPGSSLFAPAQTPAAQRHGPAHPKSTVAAKGITDFAPPPIVLSDATTFEVDDAIDKWRRHLVQKEVVAGKHAEFVMANRRSPRRERDPAAIGDLVLLEKSVAGGTISGAFTILAAQKDGLSVMRAGCAPVQDVDDDSGSPPAHTSSRTSSKSVTLPKGVLPSVVWRCRKTVLHVGDMVAPILPLVISDGQTRTRYRPRQAFLVEDASKAGFKLRDCGLVPAALAQYWSICWVINAPIPGMPLVNAEIADFAPGGILKLWHRVESTLTGRTHSERRAGVPDRSNEPEPPQHPDTSKVSSDPQLPTPKSWPIDLAQAGVGAVEIAMNGRDRGDDDEVTCAELFAAPARPSELEPISRTRQDYADAFIEKHRGVAAECDVELYRPAEGGVRIAARIGAVKASAVGTALSENLASFVGADMDGRFHVISEDEPLRPGQAGAHLREDGDLVFEAWLEAEWMEPSMTDAADRILDWFVTHTVEMRRGWEGDLGIERPGGSATPDL